MRELILTLFILTYSVNCFSQSNKQIYENRLDSLEQLKSNLEERLQNVESQIDSTQHKIAQIEYDKLQADRTTLHLKSDTYLFEEPDPSSKRFYEIGKGEEVLLLGINDSNYLEVNHNGNVGFISSWHFEREEMLKNMIAKKRNELAKEEEKKEEQAREYIDSLRTEIESDKRWVQVLTANLRDAPNTNSTIQTKLNKGELLFLQSQDGDWLNIKYYKYNGIGGGIENEKDLLSRYGEGWIHQNLVSKEEIRELSRFEVIKLQRKEKRKEFVEDNPDIRERFKQAIINGSVMLGMTKKMVKVSWGEPNDINRTVTTNNIREQWIYGSIKNRRYLYFENGILTSFQD